MYIYILLKHLDTWFLTTWSDRATDGYKIPNTCIYDCPDSVTILQSYFCDHTGNDNHSQVDNWDNRVEIVRPSYDSRTRLYDLLWLFVEKHLSCPLQYYVFCGFDQKIVFNVVKFQQDHLYQSCLQYKQFSVLHVHVRWPMLAYQSIIYFGKVQVHHVTIS